MWLNCHSQIISKRQEPAVSYAVNALYRDMKKVFQDTQAQGGEIILKEQIHLPSECYHLYVKKDALYLAAGDILGFVYGLFEISRRFLHITPFWFWNDQKMHKIEGVELPDNFEEESKPAKIRYRGWFLNDETLISHWKVGQREDMPFIMAFEVLLRLGGNMVIPGTGSNAVKYRKTASDMGLILTHHHAEPLGSEMFAHAYPDLEPMYSKYPEKFHRLWQEGIKAQEGMTVVWNIGFRGQGDCPFWNDDPQYDTQEKRGRLISSLILEQYKLVKEANPDAVCCTNLYGETMELYQEGYLQLPADVIKIWADNGYGKMVSRRQGNYNPRISALPDKMQEGAHGLYYHASFYDLQAASHITGLPNSAEFVAGELSNAMKFGVKDYWIINCSNIKPHIYLLDLIAEMWRNGEIDVAEHRKNYASCYYSKNHAGNIAGCLENYAKAAVPYGEREDEHAGDQFYNHVPRALISQYLTGEKTVAEDILWLCDGNSLEEQNVWCKGIYEKAIENYSNYLRQCEMTASELTGSCRVLFEDSILLQARQYALWAEGAHFVCRALESAFTGDYKYAFYYAGCARRKYLLSDRCMRDCEHGKWIDFYHNECQTDISQTAALCAYMMSYVRNMGEGPHFWQWMREFMDSEEERRILLILNTEKHPDDNQLWRYMEQYYGE